MEHLKRMLFRKKKKLKLIISLFYSEFICNFKILRKPYKSHIIEYSKKKKCFLLFLILTKNKKLKIIPCILYKIKL